MTTLPTKNKSDVYYTSELDYDRSNTDTVQDKELIGGYYYEDFLYNIPARFFNSNWDTELAKTYIEFPQTGYRFWVKGFELLPSVDTRNTKKGLRVEPNIIGKVEIMLVERMTYNGKWKRETGGIVIACGDLDLPAKHEWMGN
tara:strand:- start:78 stop:506 length:429 start_codon:yes stop_codon:yes gene_type:complete